MAAAGTRVGTGYVEIHPDFSRFQEMLGKRLTKSLAPGFKEAGRRAGKDFAAGIDRGGIGRSFAPLLKRFEKFGDDAGKAIASRVGRGATKATTDMFGLADAIGEVEKRAAKAGRASKGLERDMFGINREAKASGKSLRSASTQLKDWAVNAKGADGRTRRFGATLGSLGSGLRATTRGLRVTSGGLGGFDGGMARVNRGAQFFRNILRTIKWPVLIAGIGLTAQGLSALAAGAVAATSAIGPLTGALVTLPAAALLAAQAFGALKLATAGVGDAVKAALDAEVQGGAQAVDTLRAQEDAAERVADAKRNLIDVQEQARSAQDDLREARESATRQLQDMRRASEESGRGEAEAVLALREARRELNETLRDPESSGLDVRGAELAVERARDELESARVEARRVRQDYRDAKKAGVQGMPEVVAAKEAEESANRAVTDAERERDKAIRDAADAMREQGAAVSTLSDKMSQLPRSAQAFVRELVSLKPRLDDLRATAADGFFPGASAGLQGLLGNFSEVRTVVGETARALGGLAKRAGKRFGSDIWGKDLLRLGRLNTRALNRMGDAGLNLADAFRHILVAATPFLDWLSQSTLQLSEWIEGEAEAARETGRLGEFFDRTRTSMELLGPILKGVGGGLLNVGEAARPLGNEILKSLGDAAEGWREWTDSTKGQNHLKRYFAEVKPAIWEMGRLIRDVVKVFFELGKQRGVAHLLKLVRTELLPAIRDLVGATTGWLSSFLKDFGRLRKEGVPTFEAFIQVLAEHAAEAGVKIAKALVNAFLNASIWGKLAIAGWLLHKFGGLRAFAELGARAGGRLGKSFFEAAAKWIAGTEAGGGLLGWFQNTFGRNGRIGKAAKTAGARLGPLMARGFVGGTVLALAAAQPLIADALEKHVKNPVQDALRGALGPVGDMIADAQDFIGKNFPASVPGGTLIREAFGGSDPFEVPIPKTEKALGAFRGFRQGVEREANLTRKALRRELEATAGIAERTGQNINNRMQPQLDRMVDLGGTKGSAFNRRLSTSFGDLSRNVGSALGAIIDNTREAMGSLGLKGALQKFAVKHPKFVYGTGTTPNLTGKQRGGPIDMGAPSGDSVPAMLERGEYVLNRKAVRMVGKHKLDAINFGAAPRFQMGGFAELQPPARALAQELATQGFVPTNTRAPRSGPSYHPTGQAIDYGDSVNNMGRLWSVLRPKVARLAELFGPSGLPGATLWKYGSPFSDAGLQAGHEDHIHTAITGMVGAVSQAIAKVGRFTLNGPKGALRDLGQAAIDKARDAANKFIDSQMVTGSMGHGPGQAAGSDQLRDWLTTALKLSGHFSPANLADLTGRALQESGGNPRAINLWDSNARAGTPSKGLLQTIDPTFNAYKMKGLGDIWNPVHNAVAAIRYMMDRYGHIVGPSDSGYATGGLVEAMRLGGFVGLQGGGQADKAKPGKRKYAPMQRHLERFASLGLGGGKLQEFTDMRGRLVNLSERAEQFSEWASNASSLTIDGADGETIQGEFAGGTEGNWILQQLQALGSLRNQLITAQALFTEMRERVEAMVEQAKRQLAELLQQLAEGRGRRNKLLHNLGEAREALSNAQKDKNPERRRDRVAKARQTIAELSEQVRVLDFRQMQRHTLAGEIKENVMPRLGERLDSVKSALMGTTGGGEGFIGLHQVQGLAGPMNQIATYGADQPPIGTLGGDILMAQARLRQIAEEGKVKVNAEDSDDSERALMLEELLRQANQRTAISDLQRVALEGWDQLRRGINANLGFQLGGQVLPPFGGIAHTGAVVPGPRSAERTMITRGGEVIFTPEQVAALPAAISGDGVTVTINGSVTQEPGDTRPAIEVRNARGELVQQVQSTPGTGRKHPSAFSTRP